MILKSQDSDDLFFSSDTTNKYSLIDWLRLSRGIRVSKLLILVSLGFSLLSFHSFADCPGPLPAVDPEFTNCSWVSTSSSIVSGNNVQVFSDVCTQTGALICNQGGAACGGPPGGCPDLPPNCQWITTSTFSLDGVNECQQVESSCTGSLATTSCVTPIVVTTPTSVAPPSPVSSAPPIDTPSCKSGSIIRTDDQSVGEAVPIVGTSYNIVYFSDRVLDRADDRTLNIPLSGDAVAGVSQIRLEIKIAGQDILKSFSPAPNLSYSFTWNGLDKNGNLVGTQSASVTVSYDYPSQPSLSVTTVATLGHWEAGLLGMGGWTPDVVHRYDALRSRLMLGTGMVRNLNAQAHGSGYLATSQDGSEVYLFDSTGAHLSTLNGLTGDLIVSFSYDSLGHLAKIVDAYGNQTLISANSITAPFGQVTSLQRDANNNLVAITNPNNESYKMTSSSGGLLLTFQKPNGLISKMSYNSQGVLLKDLGQGGNFTALMNILSGLHEQVTATTALGRMDQYNITTTPLSSTQVIVDPRGLTSTIVNDLTGTSSSSDPTGLISQTTSAPDVRYGFLAPLAGSSSSVVNGTNLNLTSSSTQSAKFSNSADPLTLTQLTTLTTLQGDPSRVLSSNYLAATKTLITTSPMGRVQATSFDSHGAPLSVQSGDLAALIFSYDSHGRTVNIAQGARSTLFKYDTSSNLQSVQDSLGRVTSYVYDRAGRVTSETSPNGEVTRFSYDSAGNLTSLTPPSRPAHQFSFNLFELVSSYLPPALGGQPNATNYSYNLDKQLTSISRPDGKVINFSYDAKSGVLNLIKAPDASIAYTYSATTGLTNSVTSFDGITTNYQYMGPLVSSTANTGGVAGTIGFSYTPDFHLASMTVNGSAPITYSYDKDSLLMSAGAETLTRSAKDGLVTASSLGNVSEAIAYDSLAEPMSDQFLYKGKNLFQLQFKRDTLGRIIEKDETFGDQRQSAKYSYAYDKDGRLASVSLDGFFQTKYSYDPNGNRLNHHAVYDNQDRLLQMGRNKYSYNDNGDLVQKKSRGEETQYVYDSLGNLKSVIFPSHHGDWDKKDKKGFRIDYVIDGQNRRVGKKVNGVLTKMYVYQSQLQISAELDGSGKLLKQFIYGEKANVPDYMITSKGTFRILSDQVGTPRLVVNTANGSITEQLNYDAFGNRLIVEDLDWNDDARIPFSFAGGLYDHHTRLVRFGARDYDPETGRWMSKDPLLFGGGDTNLYGYVLQDPINNIDATGKGPLRGILTVPNILIGGTIAVVGANPIVNYFFPPPPPGSSPQNPLTIVPNGPPPASPNQCPVPSTPGPSLPHPPGPGQLPPWLSLPPNPDQPTNTNAAGASTA
jgi:RHS repeat-associated protein